MRFRLALAVLAFFCFTLPAAAAETFVPNDPCNILGATHMAQDSTGLVMCGLVTGSTATSCESGGGCIWKLLTGGGCYVQYKSTGDTCRDNACCLSGFKNMGSPGDWGRHFYYDIAGANYFAFCPPGAVCNASFGKTYVCCR